MKKTLLLLAYLGIAISSSAQLKVNSGGKVGVIMSTPVPQAELSVGNSENTNYSSYSFGIWTRRTAQSSFNIGIKGYGTTPNHSGRTFGVQAVGGSGTNGWNFGLAGSLGTTSNGAAIFGSILHPLGVNTHGRYAGYFDGSVYITDTLTVSTVVTPSDMRLKENIAPLPSSTLDKVMDMNVFTYNYKNRVYEDEDTLSNELKNARLAKERRGKIRHIGLSAQELQEIYPELVIEGQDGYLGVNYVELVPILIRSIQELKAELDEVKGENEVFKARSSAFEDNETTDINDATSIPAAASLAQNTPNPFSERTTIRFTLPENAKNAFIYVFDMSGKMYKQIPVDSSMQSVTIEGYELSAGMYIYSLVIGGKEIQTRRMILSK